MNILCVGDVCGDIGCEAVRNMLPEIKKNYQVDFTIINGENSADGNGITKFSAEKLFCYGADVITGGNHSLRQNDAEDLFDNNEFVLRPHNISCNTGSGYCLFDMGRQSIAVINLLGKIYLERNNAENPFLVADELIEKAKADGAKIIIVDFHAEATSEKRAMGLYLDGKVSVVYGTHTHVQTADEQILKNGTGYITDIGMTGPKDSILGVESEIIISRLRDNKTDKFKLAGGQCMLNACLFCIDDGTGMVKKVERIYI